MQNDPLLGERGAKSRFFPSISFLIDPPFKRKKKHFFKEVVLLARRSAAERNKIARRFEEERNKIARSFGGEMNKITRSFGRKGIEYKSIKAKPENKIGILITITSNLTAK